MRTVYCEQVTSCAPRSFDQGPRSSRMRSGFTHYYMIMIMKNFNSCNSHDHYGSKRRELTQNAHSHGSRAFTHTLTPTQVQPRDAKSQLSYYFSVHAGSFRFSESTELLHGLTTGSVTCVHDDYSACVCTLGLGTMRNATSNVSQ